MTVTGTGHLCNASLMRRVKVLRGIRGGGARVQMGARNQRRTPAPRSPLRARESFVSVPEYKSSCRPSPTASASLAEVDGVT